MGSCGCARELLDNSILQLTCVTVEHARQATVSLRNSGQRNSELGKR